MTELSLILTIIALSLAICQTWIALQQSKEARRQTNNLLRISDTLSTKYIGNFPKYLPNVKQLIDKTENKLLILCVNPLPGAFNHPRVWRSIKRAVEDARDPSRSVEISCIFGSPTELRNLLEDQYDEARKDWTGWRSENKDKIQHFLQISCNRIDIQQLTFEEFIDLMIDCSHTEALRTTYNGAKVEQINVSVPVHMWIADNRQAIFVFRTTEPTYTAAAFWTSDGRLITALCHTYQEYLKLSHQHDNNSNFDKQSF